MNPWGGTKRIYSQKMTPDGVLTEYYDGTTEMLPYLVDSNGQGYLEIFPNDPETWRVNDAKQ